MVNASNFQPSGSEWIPAPRSLQVPEAIHDAWKKGGETRTKLAETLQEANFQKDRKTSSKHIQTCMQYLNMLWDKPC